MQKDIFFETAVVKYLKINNVSPINISSVKCPSQFSILSKFGFYFPSSKNGTNYCHYVAKFISIESIYVYYRFHPSFGSLLMTCKQYRGILAVATKGVICILWYILLSYN